MRSESSFTDSLFISHENANLMLELYEQVDKEHSVHGCGRGIVAGHQEAFATLIAPFDSMALKEAREIIRSTALELAEPAQNRGTEVSPGRFFWKQRRRLALREISMRGEIAVTDFDLAIMIKF